jgi:hypothetical protein
MVTSLIDKKLTPNLAQKPETSRLSEGGAEEHQPRRPAQYGIFPAIAVAIPPIL